MPSSSHRHPFDLFLIIGLGILSLYAVLAYGLTTSETRELFDFGLGFLLVLWGIGLVIQKRAPQIHWVKWLFPALIMIYGWISVGNAKFIHNWENGGEFVPVTESWGFGWLFGTNDLSLTFPVMVHLSLLFGGFWVLSDLSRSRTNRRQLIAIVALLGLMISLIGIFQKASGSQTMLFFDELLTERRFFASYRYHGNAATLLNFAWPLACVLLLRAKIKDTGPFANTIWGTAALFTLAAVFVNTSKIGQVLGALMVPVFLLLYRKTIIQLIRSHPRPALAVGMIGVVILLLGGGLVALSFSTSVDRWTDFGTSFDARLQTYEVCLNMLPATGFWGQGPGVFSTIFPYHAAQQGVNLDFFWHTAHEDYLQTLIEWGYAGTGLWVLFIGGVLLQGIGSIIRGDFYSGAILVGLLCCLIQATVDFPAQIASLQWIALILLAILGRRSAT